MKSFIDGKKFITAIIFIVVALLSLSVISSCTKEASNENAENAIYEANKITELEKMWSDKFGEGDIGWIANLHAPDAIHLPAGAGVVQGSEAIKAVWEGWINTEGLEISWESTASFVSASNDMAYDYGTFQMINPDSSEVSGKYVVVWTRINDEWKVAVDIYNFDGVESE